MLHSFHFSTEHTHTHTGLYLFEELQVDSHGQEVLHGARTMAHEAFFTERDWLSLFRKTFLLKNNKTHFCLHQSVFAPTKPQEAAQTRYPFF